MDKKETPPKAAHKNEKSALDEKWIKHWEEWRTHTNETQIRRLPTWSMLTFHCFCRKSSIIDRRAYSHAILVGSPFFVDVSVQEKRSISMKSTEIIQNRVNTT